MPSEPICSQTPSSAASAWSRLSGACSASVSTAASTPLGLELHDRGVLGRLDIDGAAFRRAPDERLGLSRLAATVRPERSCTSAARKRLSWAKSWARGLADGLARDWGAREPSVELAFALERGKLLIAADMPAVDEDLRHGAPSVRALRPSRRASPGRTPRRSPRSRRPCCGGAASPRGNSRRTGWCRGR